MNSSVVEYGIGFGHGVDCEKLLSLVPLQCIVFV